MGFDKSNQKHKFFLLSFRIRVLFSTGSDSIRQNEWLTCLDIQWSSVSDLFEVPNLGGGHRLALSSELDHWNRVLRLPNRRLAIDCKQELVTFFSEDRCVLKCLSCNVLCTSNNLEIISALLPSCLRLLRVNVTQRDLKNAYGSRFSRNVKYYNFINFWRCLCRARELEWWNLGLEIFCSSSAEISFWGKKERQKRRSGQQKWGHNQHAEWKQLMLAQPIDCDLLPQRMFKNF